MQPARRGRPEAAGAIWSWQATPEPASSNPASRLWRRGLVQGVAGFGVGAAFFLLGIPALAAVAATIAGVVLLSALVSPAGLYAAIDRLFQASGRWVGRALSWILLPAIFYLVFTPFGRLFRRGRRDAMRRFFEPGADTYWRPHREIPPARSYRRLF